MHLNPYLFFNGNAEEVLEYYRSALGGDVQIMRFEGSPAADSAPGVIMASDATTDRVKNPGDNFALSIATENETEADAVFSKLSAGGKVTMPLEKTFWNAKFGMLTDKFGISWMVNCQLS